MSDEIATPIYVGIDVSRKTLDVALLRPATEYKKAPHKNFPNTAEGHTALLEWLHQNDAFPVHACLEATGTFAQDAALALRQAGHTVSIVNPARTHAFAKSLLKRTKTDKVDARLIAHFCATQQPEVWIPIPPEVQQLQALVRRIENLQEMKLMEQNRLSAGLHSPVVQQSIQDHLAFIEEQIKTTQRQIKDHLDQNPDLKTKADLLESIPGIGQSTAALLLAELGDMQQFASARQVVAFAGLSPCARQSGTSIRGRERLSKIGSRRLRKALYFPAIVARHHNPLIEKLSQRLLEKGKCKMVAQGAAMRKLLHLAFGVLKSQKPFDPNFAATTA
jgi:transposase